MVYNSIVVIYAKLDNSALLHYRLVMDSAVDEVVVQNQFEIRKRLLPGIEMKWAVVSSGAAFCDGMYNFYKNVFIETELAKCFYYMARLN